MKDLDMDDAEWELLDLEWHQGFAFVEGALLVEERARDVYLMLQREGRTPAEQACQAATEQFPASPLVEGEPLWRHRVHRHLLRDVRADYYALPRYFARYGYHPLQALPVRVCRGLQSLGHDHWRDQCRAYFCHDYGQEVIDGAQPERLALVHPVPENWPAGSVLFSDGDKVFLGARAIASAEQQVRGTNHPAYQVISGQVCRGGVVLHQKDGSPLPIANPDGFQMLAWRWGTDGHSVIVQAQQGSSIAYEYFYRIDNVDLATFSVLNERYAKDARRAYYLTGKTLRYVGDFRLLNRVQSVFDAGGRILSQSEAADPYFAVDDQFVYCNGTRLRGADGPSFRHLGFDYYADRHRVYRRSKPLDVDVESFVVAQLERGEGNYSPLLVGDRHGPLGSDGVIDDAMLQEWSAYFEAHPQLQDYWWHRLQAPSASTAQALRSIGSGFELGSQVHFHGRPINGLDAGSFKLLDTHLCGDANGLYLIPFHRAETRVPERFSSACADHYRALGGPYLTDGQRVFCHSVFYQVPEPMAKADLASFESCGHGWARDKGAVYYYGARKKPLDPAHTRVMGSYAFTATLMFAAGKPLEVEFSPEEVMVPHPDFLQLGTRKLFCGRRPVSAKRIDLASLEFVADRYARDKQRFYQYDGYATLSEISAEQYHQALKKAPAGDAGSESLAF
ncbi:hypothetical protein BS643_18220 [Pseudomonas protegens]|uniref:DKNYY domain-containing protein n=1 Tax=Pseudomonas TaxID=286 RepID=UPI00080712BE|nr:DKNYY domain-containing protein [Pseudomonas protegens]OBZ22523.1 hypothetical protein BBH58_17335 [Pseudomonas protegens]OBZ26807.1 hypothetical protein BBH57_24005 [Pseudomonas protegens]OKK41342.1 hypothetical protein BS643_18220 [Pseudomonas protegens]OKK43415.1 hypothetical protein BS644_22990 [Pseudomonas protegens]OKK55439.1 hypothetical protein BS646_29935 [Pseudomonas protegens]